MKCNKIMIMTMIDDLKIFNDIKFYNFNFAKLRNF